MSDFIPDEDFSAIVRTTGVLANIASELDELETDVLEKLEDLVAAIRRRNEGAGRYNSAAEVLAESVEPLLETVTCDQIRGDLEDLQIPQLDTWTEPVLPFARSAVYDAEQVELRQRA